MTRPKTGTDPEHNTGRLILETDAAKAAEAVRAVAALLGADAYLGGAVPLHRLSLAGPLAGASREAARGAVRSAVHRGWLRLIAESRLAGPGEFGGRPMRLAITVDGAAVLAAQAVAAEGRARAFRAAAARLAPAEASA